MNPKSLGILCVVTLVVVIAAFVSLGKDTGASEPADTPDVLFPDLTQAVNDATELAITKAGQTTTLARQDGAWVCREYADYGADFEKVRSTLVSLARMEVVEPMTKDPAQHARLGVDPETGTQVVLRGASGVLCDVVIGDTQYARTGQQVFARRSGEAQAWRCEAELTLSADPKTWIDNEIMRLDSSRPSKIEITHADGETVTATREFPAAPNWTVADVPGDRGLKSEAIANGMGTALSYLSLDDVKRADDLALGENHAATARVTTYNGLVVDVRLARIDDENWVTLDVSHQDSAPTVGPTAPGEDGENAEPDVASLEAIAAEARTLDARFDGWAYKIPQFKADLFLRRMEDLLAPLPVEPPTPIEEGPVPEPAPPGADDEGIETTATETGEDG